MWGVLKRLLAAPSSRVMCLDCYMHGCIECDYTGFLELPKVEVEWIGATVVCHVHCSCGAPVGYRSDYIYAFQCPHCHRLYEFERPEERRRDEADRAELVKSANV